MSKPVEVALRLTLDVCSILAALAASACVAVVFTFTLAYFCE